MQVTHYFHSNSLVKRQTDASVQAFLEASADFGLTLAEKLQLINLCPTTLVEVYLSVDEIEPRLGSERAAELLEIINRTLYVEESQEEPTTHAAPGKMVLTERKSNGKGHGKPARGGRGKFRGSRGGRGGGRGGSKA